MQSDPDPPRSATPLKRAIKPFRPQRATILPLCDREHCELIFIQVILGQSHDHSGAEQFLFPFPFDSSNASFGAGQREVIMAKYQVLLLALTFSLLFCDAIANKPRKFKKFKKHKSQSHGESHESFEKIIEEEKKTEEMKRLEHENVGQEEMNRGEEEKSENNNYLMFEDPCADKHCGAGRVCEVTPEGKAACVCIPSCNRETDPRRKVCSNHNETWNSDCEVYQMRCWCDHQNENCLGEEYKHVHINYYGPCKQLPPCTEDEMADFPRRMRDWLFNIMRDMADRNALSAHYLKMEREAESNYTRKWINSAIWKWCDLDEHPHDRSVSRHELFPIKAPLMALEHCIAPFLDKCDDNNDHRITLQEWGKCLELPEDELEEQCDEIREE